MKKNNKKINIPFFKVISTILVLGISLSLTSCFEDEKELFYQSTVAAFVDDGVEDTTEVEFTNVSALVEGDEGVIGAASYLWDFGDSNVTDGTDSSTDENPSYTYPDEFKYDVTFTVTDADGVISSSTRTITVDDGIDTESKFSFDQTGTGSFDFINSSTDSLNYLWDFGNDETSTDENPSTSYDDLGEYNVVLRIEASHYLSDLEDDEQKSAFDELEQVISIGALLEAKTELEIAEEALADAEADLEEAEDDGDDDDVAAAEAVVAAAEAVVASADDLKVVITNSSIGMDSNFDLTITNSDTNVVELSNTIAAGDVIDYVFDEAGEYVINLDGTFTKADATVVNDSSSFNVSVNDEGLSLGIE